MQLDCDSLRLVYCIDIQRQHEIVGFVYHPLDDRFCAGEHSVDIEFRHLPGLSVELHRLLVLYLDRLVIDIYDFVIVVFILVVKSDGQCAASFYFRVCRASCGDDGFDDSCACRIFVHEFRTMGDDFVDYLLHVADRSVYCRRDDDI